MAIFTNRPNANDILAVSQVHLKDNFIYLRDALGKDHDIAFGQVGTDPGVGIHKQVSLKVAASADPGLTANANAMVYAFGGNLYWKNATTPTGVKLTVTNAALPTTAASGATFLPGNLLLQWGQSTSGAGIVVVPFTVAFSAAPYSVVANVVQNQNTTVTAITATAAANFSFQVFKTSNSSLQNGLNINWIAIGPA